jgi:hypothetical protein
LLLDIYFRPSFSKVMATTTETPPAVAEPIKDTIDDMLLLSALREEGKAELLDILNSMRGSKCLVVDVQLGGLLNQIIVEGSKFLKDNGVDHLRELNSEPLDDFSPAAPNSAQDGTAVPVAFAAKNPLDEPDNIIYLVRPQLPMMGLIANQIKLACKEGKLMLPQFLFFSLY